MLLPPRTAGEEEQHRVVSAAPANHHDLVLATDPQPGEFRDAARHLVAVRGHDGCCGGGQCDDESQRD